MAKKSTSNVGKVVAVSVGIAAVSAATYLLFGKDGKRNQKQLKGWMLKMKGEVVEKIEGMQEVTESAYEDIVKKVTAKYGEMKNVDPKELEAEIASLKKQWKEMMEKHGPKKAAPKKKTVKK